MPAARGFGRAGAAELARLDLRAHSLLEGVPLHDVWWVDLPGGGPGRTLADLRALLAGDALTRVSPWVRALFGMRAALGRVFRWDADAGGAPTDDPDSYLHRLAPADRESSLAPPGSRDGPFVLLYLFPDESLAEAKNATVHAFSLFHLEERTRETAPGYRLLWGIYVRPVSRITLLYMAAIDPFRRLIVYPGMLRWLRRAWAAAYAGREAVGAD